jgi:hypothetical protein
MKSFRRKGDEDDEATIRGKARRGTLYQASAIWSTRSQRYTRCENYGGLSTGPKTAEGVERIRRVTKHG